MQMNILKSIEFYVQDVWKSISAHPLYGQVDEDTHVENHVAIIYVLVICHNRGPPLCNLTISLRSNGNAYQFSPSRATTVISLRIALRKITRRSLPPFLYSFIEISDLLIRIQHFSTWNYSEETKHHSITKI